MTQIETPVLVVGGGPVGLAMAGDLGWRGVPCTLIEQTDGSIYQPRQDLVGIRTMEHCRRWGITGDVEASPYPRDYAQDNVYCTGLNGYELGRFAVPAMGDTKPPPQSPQIRERCPQNMFDPILQKFARSFDCVDLHYKRRLLDIIQYDDHVVAQCEDSDSGERHTIRARYVVGCDGAASRTREICGIAMVGDPALTYTTNVIFRCPGLENLHPLDRAYRFIFIGPEGTWGTLVAINGADQWRFSIIGDATRTDPRTEDEVRAAIRRAVGVDFEYEILSTVPWIRKELVAERYRVGRVFVAGDSAHVTSPTGGFGMNTGIGDTVDLCWKLDAVMAGWGGTRLLDSYTAERHPVAVRNVTEASGNLRRMIGTIGRNPEIETPGAAADAVRRQVGADIASAMEREWRTLGIHLGYRYAGSPICWPDGTPLPDDEVMTYTQTARPGHRAPHVWLADGRSTLDLFGRGFVLLRLGDADPTALENAAESRGVPLETVALNEAPVAEAYGRPLVLVRPDGHVAWRGDAAPGDALALIDCVRGG